MEDKKLTNQEPNPEQKIQAENPVSQETLKNAKSETNNESEMETKNPNELGTEIQNPVGETKTDAPEQEEVIVNEVKDAPEVATPVAEQEVHEKLGSEQELLTEDSDDQDDDEEETEEDIEGLIKEESIGALNRSELVDRLQELIDKEDLQKIKSKVALIKVAFIDKTKKERQEKYSLFLQEGGDKEAYKQEDDEQDERFKATFALYREKKVNYLAQQEQLKQDNLNKKNEILEKLRELINSDETLKATYDNFKELQEQWKDIGMVPKSEVSNLWANYHFLVEKFFDKVKISKELKDLDLKKNLENKIELCEKAEELLLENSINKSFKSLQQYHQEWKEIGPVPQDKKDEIWDRFKATTDQINQRRREHYEKLHEELTGNYEAKIALCEKVEQVLTENVDSIKQWQKATDQVNELLKIWKSVGPAPRKVNDEVWERFKSSLDAFFQNKKEYFSKIKDQQINNYNLKLDLVNQAEAMQENTDWKQTTSRLIKLQEEWKKIGPVPKKHSDKIWKRFRAACDAFFNSKEQHFKGIHGTEKENLEAKKALINKIETFEYSGDKSENLNTLKEFQREWMKLGHVPFSEKDKVIAEYRKAVNEQMAKLNISSIEMSSMDFKEKVDGFKNKPEASRLIHKEISFLNGKITKMQEDINLWENNIGFLANSKNANLLKVEFEKKIEAAKKELNLMIAKVKYMRQEQK